MTEHELGLAEKFFFELPIDKLEGRHIYALSMELHGRVHHFDDKKLVKALWQLKNSLPPMRVVPDCLTIGAEIEAEVSRLFSLVNVPHNRAP